MIKWSMPLKCDFTAGRSHAQTPSRADKPLFFHTVATAAIEHRRRRTATTAESAARCMSVPIPLPDKLSLEQWVVCESGCSTDMVQICVI